MKVKKFSGTKFCSDGDMYKFRKGIAIVPGMRMCKFKSYPTIKSPVYITIGEFLEIKKEMKHGIKN